MQTNLSDLYKNSKVGEEAEAILRSCVHCGFCTATCPTYQILGDELDGPRGRIYLMKQVLEGHEVSKKTQLHLDRCLTCRSCETTCPSGVRYGRLVDIGREIVEKQVKRTLPQRLMRKTLRVILLNKPLFSTLLSIGQALRPVLPAVIAKKVSAKQFEKPWPAKQHVRKMLILEGCVQPALTPATNIATARVLDKIGIQLIRVAEAKCCGALSHHLAATEEALVYVKQNIDAWWPYVEQGIEAILMTASGCGVMVKDYAHLLTHDVDYASKAKKIAALTKDLSEVLLEETVRFPHKAETTLKVAFHNPCTLQHGQKIKGKIESMLRAAGYELVPVEDSHLCCGSAGTYSILQPAISNELRGRKLKALQNSQPDVIVTANIGCQTHLASEATVPVRHWIELLEERL